MNAETVVKEEEKQEVWGGCYNQLLPEQILIWKSQVGYTDSSGPILDQFLFYCFQDKF